MATEVDAAGRVWDHLSKVAIELGSVPPELLEFRKVAFEEVSEVAKVEAV
jgi:hypothetical protein